MLEANLLGHAPVALLGLGGDLLLGERLHFLHPVPLMGRMAGALESLIRSGIPSSYHRLGGLVLPLVLCGFFGGGSWLLLREVRHVAGEGAWALLSVFWAVQLLAARSLFDHVSAVLLPLMAGERDEARRALARIVGRDTEDLSDSGISRGALESLWENTNDAVVAPLFFLLLGGVPLLMVYKAASTLDSMVGYRNERYLRLGWASARLDDILAFIPARLTFFLMFLVLPPFLPDGGPRCHFWGKGSCLARAWRFRRAHPSPNSGYPMAAFAALRGVRLGGGARYFGQWVEKPPIGEGPEPTPIDLVAGLFLFRMFVFSLLILLCLLALLWWRAGG